MELSCQIESLSYKTREVLHDVCFSLESGEFLSVIGRNGQGKSTLIRALSGQLSYRGSITVDERELRSFTPKDRAKQISLMPQSLFAPHVTVRELITFGRAPYRALCGYSEADQEAIDRALHDADLSALSACTLDRISGGELRRAYFGMVLAQDTPLLLLDEPTAFLDAEYEARLFGLVKQRSKERHKTVIAVMHNPEYALSYADRILFLDGGTIRFFGTPDELLQTDHLETVFSLRRYLATDEDGKARVFFSSVHAEG